MGKTYRRNKNDGQKKSAYKRNKKTRFKENFSDRTEESSSYSKFEEEKYVEKFDNRRRK